MIILVFVPISIIWFAYMNKNRWINLDWKEKYGVITDSMRVFQRKTDYLTGSRKKLLITYIALFFGRRLVFSILVVVYPNFAWFHLFVYCYCCLSMIAYIFIVWPFESELMNKVEVFNELMNLGMLYHFICCSDFIPNSALRYKIGFSQMAFFSCFITFHVSILLSE